MTHLYLRDLRKRVDALECDWGWAFPHIYEFADPSGKVYERFENKAYRLYAKELAAHEAEMARLEAELEADAPTQSPARERAVVELAPAGMSERQERGLSFCESPPPEPDAPALTHGALRGESRPDGARFGGGGRSGTYARAEAPRLGPRSDAEPIADVSRSGRAPVQDASGIVAVQGLEDVVRQVEPVEHPPALTGQVLVRGFEDLPERPVHVRLAPSVGSE